MSQLIASSNRYLVIGFGLTGLSIARHLSRNGLPFVWADSRSAPPGLDAVRAEFPNVELLLGDFDFDLFGGFSHIYVSPGLDLRGAGWQSLRQQGVSISSDIELFLAENTARVIAITGSNGKSTVTDWLAATLTAGGSTAIAAGNIGRPVLELLDSAYSFDYVVLELSSFQLDLIDRLNAEVAVLLNLTPDHLDRHGSMVEYHRAKQRVFYGAKAILSNRADLLSKPPLPTGVPHSSFGLNDPDIGHWGLRVKDEQKWLSYGLTPILPATSLSLVGDHNIANALTVLGLISLLKLPVADYLDGLCRYRGLAHRCEWVNEIRGVRFINDSKATNLGATQAALEGFSDVDKWVLVGGDSKGAKLSQWRALFAATHSKAIVYGKDADDIAAALGTLSVAKVDTLEEAFAIAVSQADAGEIVILSPACASLDQFSNFEARGDYFKQLVQQYADQKN